MEIKIPSYVIEEMKYIYTVDNVVSANSLRINGNRSLYSYITSVADDIHLLLAVVVINNKKSVYASLGKLNIDGLFESYIEHELDLDNFYCEINYDGEIFIVVPDEEKNNEIFKTKLLSSKTNNCEAVLIDYENMTFIITKYDNEDVFNFKINYFEDDTCYQLLSSDINPKVDKEYIETETYDIPPETLDILRAQQEESELFELFGRKTLELLETGGTLEDLNEMLTTEFKGLINVFK